jgi:Txe/YoeB family toxin of Txe-Axe toxin-antitoxin module
VRLVWDLAARDDYRYWQTADRRIRKRVDVLIDACLREPFAGIGKPEQLKYGAQERAEVLGSPLTAAGGFAVGAWLPLA